jgi:hypothetical protein
MTAADRPAVLGSAASPSLVQAIADGVVDARLAALVWLLVEGGVPLVVLAPSERLGAAGSLLAGALASVRPDLDLTTLVEPMGSPAVRRLTRGERPGGVLAAVSLDALWESMGSGPLPVREDELSFLGCVLVLGPRTAAPAPTQAAGALRVIAAHYVRPLSRDAHGHVQRLPPAVLATWDDRRGAWEHFDWGVLPEIAARLGRRTGDLDRDLHHREDDLAGLAKAGVTAMAEVQRLIAGYQVQYGGAHGPDDGHRH